MLLSKFWHFMSCHHFLHINFRFIKAKTYFGKKILSGENNRSNKGSILLLQTLDNFLFALKKIISVKPVITTRDSFRIETAHPTLRYSTWTHGKRANSFSNRFLCLNANMANNHMKMLLLYLIFPWSF